MFRQVCFFILTMLTSIQVTVAQEKWSLEKCVNHAIQNSLTIKQAVFTIRNQELTLKQNQMNRLPNLNGSIGGGYQFGRTINPTTNNFEQQNIGFNSIGLNASMQLYGGNEINNAIKRSKIDIQAAKLDADASANVIGLNVANAYLAILLAEEQLQNAQNRLDLSEEQLEQTDKLIQAGSLPQNDRLDILAQMALDRQGIIEAQNLVDINYLNLKQLLELDPNVGLIIERPEILDGELVDPGTYLLNEVYATALGTQPNIEANDLRLKSFLLSEDIAKAGLLPRVFLSGSVNSNASTVALDPSKVNPADILVVRGNPEPVEINGDLGSIAFFDTRINGEIPKRSYLDQVNDNFGQAVSVNVNIPIFNNFQNRTAIERARLQTLNQEVINQQDRQTLKTNVQRAIADANAAKETLQAARVSLEAATAAYNNAQRRFDLGAINSFEFSSARNRMDLAQVDLTRAKYQFVFNVKVVEFYQGKPLKLN